MKRLHSAYEIDREARAERRTTPRTVTRYYGTFREDGTGIRIETENTSSPEQAETRQLVAQLARTFAGEIEFYKGEYGGSKSHEEAVAEVLSLYEHRRAEVAEIPTPQINWHMIAAVAEKDLDQAVKLWAKVREEADDELESGRRAARIAGYVDAQTLAQFLTIRDAFNDQWKPQGGIESALIDMLTVAFSLQLYWMEIAHERATKRHNEQRKQVQRFESGGWKSPFQSEVDAIDQAYRLADGYNRQFLRVLRQMRDLRRYAPPVIVNNGGQVNIAQQQMNVTK